jgi:hypothetical protein
MKTKRILAQAAWVLLLIAILLAIYYPWVVGIIVLFKP